MNALFRRADAMPEWYEPECQERVAAALAELAGAWEWLDRNVTVHSTECPGGCAGACLSEAEASQEDE